MGPGYFRGFCGILEKNRKGKDNMKGKKIAALFASAVMVLSLAGCGRVYVIGRDVAFTDITEISLYSSGMASEDCWSLTVSPEGLSGDFEGKITGEKWQKITELFSGVQYEKMKKKKPEVLDGNSHSIYIYWDGCPEGYEAAIDSETFNDAKNKILSIALERDAYDLENLAEVEYGYSGDDIGSYGSTSLRQRSGKWIIERVTCEGNGYKEDKKVYDVSSDVMKNIRSILSEYDWKAFENLPESEIQILDGGSDHIRMEFSPYAAWCISDIQELTPEAIEMWKRIEREIEENID